MTQPRKTLVCVEQTPYYHCIGRCARRAALDTWCQRLADLCWCMRCLNEYIVRKANAEDACKRCN